MISSTYEVTNCNELGKQFSCVQQARQKCMDMNRRRRRSEMKNQSWGLKWKREDNGIQLGFVVWEMHAWQNGMHATTQLLFSWLVWLIPHNLTYFHAHNLARWGCAGSADNGLGQLISVNYFKSGLSSYCWSGVILQFNISSISMFYVRI